MAIAYFDSSALVNSSSTNRVGHRSCALERVRRRAVESTAYPKVCAALGAATRNRVLTASQASAAAEELDVFWESMRPVELSADVERMAGELASRHGLSGVDAVHLASAVALGSTDLVVAVWDKRLHSGVVAAGLAVAPATLG